MTHQTVIAKPGAQKITQRGFRWPGTCGAKITSTYTGHPKSTHEVRCKLNYSGLILTVHEIILCRVVWIL